VFRPRVQWVGGDRAADPSYFSGEFSIESILAALLYKLFSEQIVFARIVVIAFSLAGIFFLYELLHRRAGPIAARAGAFIYTLFPYHLFFGRVFMPDIPALTLALGGLLLLDRWTEDGKQRTLFAAAIVTAMAVLQKLTVIFVGLPMLYLFWLSTGRRLFARRDVYVFAAIVLAPTFAWYMHSGALARQSGFAFVQPHLFGRNLGVWLQPGFLHRIFTALSSEALSPVGLGLSLMGFFWPARSPSFSIFRLWIISAGLLLFFIPGLLSANYYYLSLLLPGAAALAGLGLAALVRSRAAYPVIGVLLAVFAFDALRSALPLYYEDRAPRDLGVVLNRLTAPGDLIVTETGGSPNVLYFADRRGWMLVHQYDLALVRKLANAGAAYYADASVADLSARREFFRAMDANFERLTADPETWPIYGLSAPAGPVRQLPPQGTRNPLHIKLGQHVELLDASIRMLTESPASFELLYYWRCLEQPATDLHLLVQVMQSTGEIAYSSASAAGRRSMSPGEILCQRTVVVLPAAVPKGKYQIWIGRPGAGQEEQRARVGEFEIRRTFHYGWFTPY
jgi:hypothetical protein